MRNPIKIALTLISALFISTTYAAAGEHPKLVVKIVVSQMKYEYLTHFRENYRFGLKRLSDEGIVCTNARFSYSNTTSPAGIATIVSGTNPNAHGILSEAWIDYTTNSQVNLISDRKYFGVGAIGYDGQFSPDQMIVSTLGDEIKSMHGASKVVSVAVNPVSAITAGGRDANAAYWFDPNKGIWVSSTYYMGRLPNWVEKENELPNIRALNDTEWTPTLPALNYKYTSSGGGLSNGRGGSFSLSNIFGRKSERTTFEKLLSTPAGMEMTAEMARNIIIYENLGKDDDPDLLVVTFDQTREISESFGSHSMEIEDAMYKLDFLLDNLISSVENQVGRDNVVFVLTSDHGACEPYRENGRQAGGLFNVMQFKVLINGFLNTQYGTGDWVTDYRNKSLYLNHTMIFDKGLNLAEIQTRIAAFALQFRGVADVVTAAAMQNNHFANGTMGRMQNGFHPKRSGDIVINLMPGWMEEQEGTMSASGSMYEYDTHVPLIWYGKGIGRATVSSKVDMTDVAPTLAGILKVNRPNASTGEEITAVTANYNK